MFHNRVLQFGEEIKKRLPDLQDKTPFRFTPPTQVSPKGQEVVGSFLQGAKGLAQSILEFPGRPVEEKLRSTGAAAPLAFVAGLAADIATPFPGGKKRAVEKIASKSPVAFKGFKDLTTKFLDYAKGKTTLSKQEITDFARRPELKKGEADLLNRLGGEVKDKVSAQQFADDVKINLLELKPVKVQSPQYGNVNIEREIPNYQQYGMDADAMAKAKLKGRNYEEVVFESPITTNGSSHYPNSKNYFAHARGDEVVEGGKKIWREQEIQSDLLQKDNLERQYDFQLGDQTLRARSQEHIDVAGQKFGEKAKQATEKRFQEVEKLQPFTNDRFGERIMRERIKEKASKGYAKYRLPTGQTIGKIEGFGGEQPWVRMENGRYAGTGTDAHLTPGNIKIGQEIIRSTDNAGNEWIITDILGDGRFKAVPKGELKPESLKALERGDRFGVNTIDSQNITNYAETFDLTGKSNPQYRRYEQWGKFLKNKFGGKEVTDQQGNSWTEIDLKKEYSKLPVEAFGAIPFIVNQEDYAE